MADDDLSALFPELAPILANWGSGGGTTTIPTDEHGGVTDEQVAEYIQRRMNGGMPVGPSPAVSGQVPQVPQFVQGQGAPPPQGGVEPPQGGDGVTTPPTAPQPQQQPQQQPVPPAQSTPPSPIPPQPQPVPPPPPQQPQPQPQQQPVPTQPSPTQPPPSPPQPPSAQLPPERVAAYAEFDQMLSQDPQLAALIAQHLQARAAGGGASATPPPPAPPQPYPQPQSGQYPPQYQQPVQYQPYQQPQPQQPFQLPPVDPADLAADPVLAALYAHAQQQSQVINSLQQSVQQTNDQIAQQRLSEATGVINTTVEQYQQQRQLTPEQMQRVRESAAQTGVLNSFINQGVPLNEAVVKTLDMAYWADEELRGLAYQQMQEQGKANQQRKQMAGAVAGASGSVPRTQPISENAGERRQQLVGEVAQVMNGTWVNPEQ